MRSQWLAYVRQVRVRENRGKKSCTYREAMKIASESWEKEKAKIKRKEKRDKACREKQKPPKSAPISPE